MSQPDGAPAWWQNRRTFGPEEGVNEAPEPDVAVKMQVRSSDYGRGTVVAILPVGIQILWYELDGAIGPVLMLHAPSFVAGLERL